MDLLDSISEVDVYDVTNDGEDWCINCILTFSCRSIKFAHEQAEKLLKEVNATWDYHYIKGTNNDEYWQP